MRRLALPLLVALSLTATASGTTARGQLVGSFGTAARDFHVPERLLLTVGYVNTRLRMPGRPAADGGVGIMHLTPAQVRHAARLIGARPATVRTDPVQNIRAGAALLASLDVRGRGLASWYEPLARLGGAPFADEVYDTLGHGFAAGAVRVPPTRVSRREPAAAGRADYPSARWYPASPRNYARANRPLSGPITTVVIHVTQGSYGGAVSWFANPRAHASAHYVIRSMDGEITQTVREKDVAWHAGNSAVNASSIGIEHEAFMSNCAWYTDAMYRSSAQLVAYLAAKYQIPLDRKHIIGHSEVPDPNHPGEYGGANHHTDPGRCWNWTKYMSLVRTFAESSFSPALQSVADDATRSTFRARKGWRRASSAGAYARSFALAKPGSSAKPAQFTLKVSKKGTYAVYAWWPAARSRNSSVPVGIDTVAGRSWMRLDQRAGGGWRYLGAYDLPRPRTTVLFSTKTSARGSIAADAVKAELLSPTRESRLASPTEGWALTPGGLVRTADGGASWQALSPPSLPGAAVRGARVSGEDASLVVAGSRRERPLSLLRIRGGSSSSTPLPVPSDIDVAGPAQVLSGDTRLFVALRMEPNRRSLARGLLLRSDDDGATWRRLALPEAGRVSFPTARDGWLVGGLAGERLYLTRNGGVTWKRRKLTPAGATGTVTYDLPTFGSPAQGVLPISVAAGSSSTLTFDTTLDGGRTWSAASQLRVRSGIEAGAAVPTAVVDPLTWFAAVGGKLVSVRDGGLTRTTVGPLPGAVSALQFASSTAGWARVGTCLPNSCSIRLFSTADGGLTWTRLRLPS